MEAMVNCWRMEVTGLLGGRLWGGTHDKPMNVCVGGKLTYGWYFGESGQAKLQPNIANPSKPGIALK